MHARHVGVVLTTHAFGGLWTAQKLDALRRYLDFFPVALQSQPFTLVYIDTFAGTGKCTIKAGPDGRKTIDGSALIALSAKRPFDEYIFIEQRRKHVAALRQLAETHPHGGRVTVHQDDAAERLRAVLAQYDWKRTRGVLFLDPYGLQCSWSMVEQVARTQALDVFFLVSLAGLARQAARVASNIDDAKAAALDRFLGTAAWRQALYRPPAQDDMFNMQPAHERDVGVEAILQFVRHRMEQAFPFVEEPLVLRHNISNAPLYALFFAVSNRSPAAISLARRVSKDVLSKAR